MPQDYTAIWLCVSTDEQNSADRTSIQTQLERCTAHTTDDIVVAVLRPPNEEGFSRFYSRLDQMIAAYPPYRRLVELIESRAITRVVTLRYDRLWRTAALATQLCALAEEYGVWLYAVEEPYDRETWLSNPWLRMIHSIQPEEAVRKLAADRRRGMIGRAERGLPICSIRPYGYRIVGHGAGRRLEVVPEEAAIVRQMFEWRAAGWGATRIAMELDGRGVPSRDGRGWSSRVVLRMLNNPTYAGYIRSRTWPRRPRAPARGEPVVHMGRGNHEAIISEDLWQTVQQVNERHVREYARRPQGPHLFTGLCRCGFCGGPMAYGKHWHRSTYSLACCRYIRGGGQACCHNGHSERRLRAAVIAWLKQALADPDSWARQIAQVEEPDTKADRLAQLERELASIDRRRQNLLNAIELADPAHDLSAMVARYEALGTRHAQVMAEVAKLKESEGRLEETKRRLLSWAEAADTLDTWSDDDLRACLLQLVGHIVLKKGEPPRIVVSGAA